MRYLISIFLVVALVSAILIIVFTGDARAMFRFFKRYDVEMSSSVKGRLTDNGNPVVGMTVYRNLAYEGYRKGENQQHTDITDSDGRFSFPAMKVKSRHPGDLFGANFPVQQAVFIKRNDELYRLWATTKIAEYSFPKLSELLLQLECDLGNKQVHYEFESVLEGQEYPVHHNVYSICYWHRDDMAIYYKDSPISSFSEID